MPSSAVPPVRGASSSSSECAHPEVEGICGWCGGHAVFENARELSAWLDANCDYWTKPITVVVQTTQTRSNFNECCDIIKKKVYKRENI